MKGRSIAVVAAAIAAVLALVVILLVSGGTNEPDVARGDASQDVAVGEGANPPTEVGLADIVSAEVTQGGSSLVFEARTAVQLPKKMPDGALVFRWEILEGATTTWIVNAEIGDGNRVSILDQAGGFGASTVDETFPGSITVSSNVLRVELRTEELTGWPGTFDWVLKTSLDADRGDGASALATDSAPDGGSVHFGD